MNFKGLTLHIDMNYILYRNVHILHKTNTLRQDLLKSLEMSIEYLTKLYPFNKIYLIADSKSSWRKRIYSEYKANRKDQRSKIDINWEFVYYTFDQYVEQIKDFTDKRIKLLRGDNIEGDDFIFYTVKDSNKKGYSCMVISSDKDLTQLLDYSYSPTYINFQLWDKHNDAVMYMPIGYEKFMDDLSNDVGDLFNMNDNYNLVEFVNTIKASNMIKTIDPEELLFTKVICGDKSDNIPSVLSLPLKSDPNKYRGIGEAGAQKIYNQYKMENPLDVDFENNQWIDNVVTIVANYKKVNVNDYYTTIKDNIINNRELIRFDETYFPYDIKENMLKCFE